MRDILITKINSNTGEARRKGVLEFPAKARRTMQKHFAFLPPRDFLKTTPPAMENFCLIKPEQLFLIKAQLSIKLGLFILNLVKLART